MDMYLQPTLASFLLAICTFNLRMLKGVCDIFSMVINFISNDLEVKHVIIGWQTQMA